MIADGADSTRTGAASPGQAAPGSPGQAAPGSPGHAPPGEPSSGISDRVARPARATGRNWWILPYSAGALAVLVVAGLIIGLRYTPGAAAQPAGVRSTAVVMPAEMFPDTLFGELTADMEAGNETAFLGLASAAAQPALRTWWENLRAIGFTTGAVVPTAGFDAVHIDSRGDGTTVVLAGAHSPLDPVDLNGKPQIPMALYQIGLHFANPSAMGQITSWQPLNDDPWDQGALYVRKAANVVVAGPPSDSALVDQTLPVAETAAAYDIGMMRHAASLMLAQQGFVVFVSGSATVANSWLATDPQPQGWPPEFFGARAVQLPGPGTTADYAVSSGDSSLVNAISDDSMGGVRVILTPAEPATKQTLATETVTLVGDFMLDIQAAHDEELANGVPVKPVPSWTEQGLAVAVQTLFEANPDPAPSAYSFATLTADLRGLPRSYRSGTYPSTQDLFGPTVAMDQDWGYVAASTYEYIDARYNITKMMVSAMEIYVGRPTPFGNVYKSGTTAENLVFFGIHSIRLGWAPWLARL
jgi:hypothetical protein